jgi:hypothetical protein
LDGNAAANRTLISYTITGLNIPDGTTFWIKWADFNAVLADDGLAVDDFSITPLSPPAPTNPSGVGAASPASVIEGVNTNTLLTVAVTPGLNPTSTGLAVSCDLSAIGGPVSRLLFDDGTNGDVTSGDNTYTFGGMVTTATTAGVKSLPCTITDAQARTGSASITVTVLAIKTIGEVQGGVTDSTNGATFESPLKGQNVVVRGVVYEKTIARTSTGSTQYGFFLQNAAATSDGDPNTSDGIFVFLSYGSTLAGYTPVVGDEIIIGAKVTEYYSFTELISTFAFYGVVRSGVDIDAEVAPFVTNPPADLAAANRYWERRESMRAQVPVGSIVTNGRNTFASSADAETWVIIPSNPLASRVNPYARRAFRDAHPLDDNYDPANWDGNGYRILMGSLGLKGASGNNTTMIAPSRTFDTLTNAPTGGLYYQFSKYTVMVAEQPTYNHGPDPSLNAPPSDLPRSQNYSIVTYNLENLYDYRDDPNDGCDFSGGANTGCAKDGQTVKPAYDYVPPSDAAYQERLTDIANQIIADLHAPDILLAQEAED